MQFFRFSIIFLLLQTNGFSAEMFSDMECLNSNFDSTVEHKAMPFGLSKNIVTVSKSECLLTIAHSKLKFIKSHWTIDVCRGPVHIKKTSGAVEVLKREKGCLEGSSEYCKEVKKIETILQDDGLIFATGQKEDISNEHGKIYCSVLLLKRYLGDGIIFNRGSDYQGILLNGVNQKALNKVNSDESTPVEDGPAEF
ncbi:hypothetical protein [Halobacteriovorax sp. HLS]|uniref:hypothetical protein n=1 Tax=Halobacteriovorax sp. HLS TaxID=2234000 RepID=UPI000FDB2677|nr:hypothetical protein [Halobacteriovorax sp. HLS]